MVLAKLAVYKNQRFSLYYEQLIVKVGLFNVLTTLRYANVKLTLLNITLVS